MAGLKFNAVSGEVSVTGTNADTVLAVVAPTNQGILIHKIKLGFKGTTVGNEPVTVEYIRFTSDGTGTSVTLVKKDSDAGETIQSTSKHTYTVEPTGVTVIESFPIHPQGSFFEIMPIEDPYHVHGGEGFGIRITPDDTVSVMVTFECEE